MKSQIFGWHGFSIPCPEDFSPNSLSGDRSQGYARLSSSGSLELQVRWVSCRKEPDVGKRLGAYLHALRTDAQKRKLNFEFETNDADAGIGYRWTADRQGRGFAQYRPNCHRLFIVEWNGDRKASLGPLMKDGMDGFESSSAYEPELWSIAGLAIRLPQAAKLKSHLLQTGKTQLHWLADKTALSAGRSAFGRELLGKMSLAEWASTIAPKGTVGSGEHGVRITSSQRRGLATITAVTLARFDEGRNQLMYVNSMFRDDKWEPQWDWFA